MYGIINYASSISIVWLSAIAILAFIVFAVSISIPLSTVMLIAVPFDIYDELEHHIAYYHLSSTIW